MPKRKKTTIAASLFLVAIVAHFTIRTPLFLALSQILILDNVPLKQADAIFIMGGGSVKRIDTGLALYNKRLAPVIVVSGGAYLHTTEAALIKDYAITQGTPSENILLEERARNSYENALYSKNLLEKIHAKEVIIVTSDFHTRRTRAVFNKVFKASETNFQITGTPYVTNKQWWKDHELTQVVVSEWAKLIVYKLKGWI